MYKRQGLSVSRVGGSAQCKAMKKMSGSLKIELAQYRELAAFAQFGSDDLDDVTKKQLSRGAVIVELLKQPQYKPVPLENQVCLLYLASEGLLDEIDVNDVSKYEEAWNDHSSATISQTLKNIRETGDLTDEDMAEIKKTAIDFNKTLAFENFKIITNPLIYEFSNIDFPPSDNQHSSSAEKDYFTLFEFSAKFDPVPTMLTQNHSSIINGFMGQTTGYNKEFLKKHVLVMGEDYISNQAKYIHGNAGKGTFTFLGGHDPEDYKHFVGDPPTDLNLHRNSPGYRLILNNILFPAAKKKKRKT